jgi:hypothetical protein
MWLMLLVALLPLAVVLHRFIAADSPCALHTLTKHQTWFDCAAISSSTTLCLEPGKGVKSLITRLKNLPTPVIILWQTWHSCNQVSTLFNATEGDSCVWQLQPVTGNKLHSAIYLQSRKALTPNVSLGCKFGVYFFQSFVSKPRLLTGMMQRTLCALSHV